MENRADSGEKLICALRAALGIATAPELALDAPLLSMAQRHSVFNLLYYALSAQAKTIDPALLRALKEAAFGAATRDAVQQNELNALLAAFEKEKITVLPLKGVILKHLYPKPEMRYMSDADLLIKPAQATKVKQCLTALGYQSVKIDSTATDFYLSPLGMNYELHLDLTEEGANAPMREFLHSLLDRATPRDGYSSVMQLPHEEHYAYVLCHFVKHFINGGIGVRAVMDVWICRKKWKMDELRLQALLETLDLPVFAQKVEHLAAVWFDTAEPDALSEELGDYILSGAVFGTQSRRIADQMVRQKKSGSRANYLLRRTFLPMQQMCAQFPVLKECPALLPFFWVWRALRALFFRRHKLQNEISVLQGTDDAALQDRADFFRRCGLNIGGNK